LALTPAQRTRLKVVVQLEGDPVDGLTGWDTLLSSAAGLAPVTRTQNLDGDEEIAANQVATILYTSGTTGQPKGVPLTHANLLHQIRSLACVAYPKPGDPVLSVLPIWHAYERSASYFFLSCACTQTYTTIKQLKKDLPRVQPIAMATVPRLWESVQAGFEDVVKTFPPSRQRLLRAALSNSSAQRQALGRTIPGRWGGMPPLASACLGIGLVVAQGAPSAERRAACLSDQWRRSDCPPHRCVF
jgi:long-chain acyl-CoA synthetase